MKQLKSRREFFESSQNLDNQQDFISKTEQVRNISLWAADKLGLCDNDKQDYVQKNISVLVRENAVHQMVARIQRDLFEADIDVKKSEILSQI
jgi:hypothetical protein